MAITGDEDVLSALPEAILCDILSFLDTKESVRTSVLSKRWKLVWTSVPTLHCRDSASVSPTCFANSVDRFLSLNTVSHFREFSLHCFLDYDESRVDAWVDATITREIQILDLDLHFPSLPNGFFNRNNLVVLRLSRVMLDVPKLVHFPSLKIIQLHIVHFLNDDSLKNLLSGCLVLEKLSIETYRFLDNPFPLYICSSTLQFLRLYTRSAGGFEDYRYKVVIEAPKLSEFHLDDFMGNEYHLGSLSCLHTSDIHFEVEHDDMPSEDSKNRILELLRKISHIEYLCSSVGTMHCLEDATFSNFPMFNNLTHLAVSVNDPLESWEVVPRLLDCSPNLVHFDFEDDCDFHFYCQWPHPLDSVPKCLLSRLETFITSTPRANRDCGAVMEMIEYFLSNAMVLKKMLVRCKISDLEMKLELCSQLLMLPRSSSICKIELLQRPPFP